MTPTQRAIAKRRQIEQAIFPLVGDTRFQSFMEVVRDQLEVAVEDAVSDRVIANDKTLAIALGEIRCYKAILSVYENFQQQAESEQDQHQEAEG